MSVVEARPLKESNKITRMLDVAFGENRFDEGPVPIEHIVLSYSRDISPEGLIHAVQDLDIPGCMGALVFSENRPRQWSIVCHKGQSAGRRAFTIAHEFGHFILLAHSSTRATNTRMESIAAKTASCPVPGMESRRKRIPSRRTC